MKDFFEQSPKTVTLWKVLGESENCHGVKIFGHYGSNILVFMCHIDNSVECIFCKLC